jgi:hypothetical protein
MKNFETSDLHLASFLRAKGAHLVNHRQEQARIYFAFEYRKDLQKWVEEYWNDGRIGVSSYVKSLADLKTIIFNYRKY